MYAATNEGWVGRLLGCVPARTEAPIARITQNSGTRLEEDDERNPRFSDLMYHKLDHSDVKTRRLIGRP